ncbi:SPOR domain-containing protein [Fodinibius salsisoli]|uniref:SPOR domain-containing protein n=1 Tax=Fodinibius salsisoli TaxID=2820877 RepID=A0ABT3PH50_9BACT|nr:SPOR domain-containing protein [Fodinibius salsisoli]MCW9705242.1 SPOR domain-containing protein [Fodinibius salsisoli]
MDKRIIFSLITAVMFGILTGCGPSEEERRQAEQARQDSLEKIQKLQQLEQQRQDSIEQARLDSLAAANQKQEKEEQQISVNFDPDGSYSVQVEAWRSRAKAEGQVQKWVDRGFENAFVVKYGQEETGNIWFRVRLGRLSSRAAAENLREQISSQYDVPSWISSDAG